MIPSDAQARLLLAAARHETLRAAAAGTSRPGARPLRRRLGRALVAMGARLAGEDGARSAAPAGPPAAPAAGATPACSCC